MLADCVFEKKKNSISIMSADGEEVFDPDGICDADIKSMDARIKSGRDLIFKQRHAGKSKGVSRMKSKGEASKESVVLEDASDLSVKMSNLSMNTPTTLAAGATSAAVGNENVEATTTACTSQKQQFDASDLELDNLAYYYEKFGQMFVRVDNDYMNAKNFDPEERCMECNSGDSHIYFKVCRNCLKDGIHQAQMDAESLGEDAYYLGEEPCVNCNSKPSYIHSRLCPECIGQQLMCEFPCYRCFTIPIIFNCGLCINCWSDELLESKTTERT